LFIGLKLVVIVMPFHDAISYRLQRWQSNFRKVISKIWNWSKIRRYYHDAKI